MFDWIAFDADDTLWRNEPLYQAAQERLVEILRPYGLDGRARAALFETEMRNLPLYGYGLKSFGLSMIETAVRLTEGRVRGDEIGQIVDLVRGMAQAPVRLLEGVAEAVAELSASHPLMLITKGDLLDQERKLARSGLAAYFDHVEIVSDKDADVYRALLARRGIEPQRFLMVGNSLRSDVLPVVELGGHAVHIPYHTTWAHEVVAAPEEARGYTELAHIGQLADFVRKRSALSRSHALRGGEGRERAASLAELRSIAQGVSARAALSDDEAAALIGEAISPPRRSVGTRHQTEEI